jgi:hypothetical protein
MRRKRIGAAFELGLAPCRCDVYIDEPGDPPRVVHAHDCPGLAKPS